MFDNYALPNDKVNYALNFRGYPPFHTYVYLGDTQALRAYFSNPAMLSLINVKLFAQGLQSPLHVACMGSANEQTVSLMLNFGAAVFAADEFGRLPIHIAANAGQKSILKLLLKNMGDVNLASTHNVLLKLDNYKRSLLHAICMPGSSTKEKRRGTELVDALRVILDCFAPAERLDALQQPDIYNVTPLMYAKHYRFHEILNYAERLGQDISAIPAIPKASPAAIYDYWGRLKIQEAAFDSDLQQVHALLKQSQNHPMIGNPQFANINTLHYAVLNGTPEIVNLILRDVRTNPLSVDNDSRNALHYAAARADSKILTLLLQNRYIENGINTTDRFGMNALHALAMNSNTSILKIEDRLLCLHKLIAAGADVFAVNNNGDTPYEVAIKCHNYSVALKLSELAPRPMHRVPELQQRPARLRPEFVYANKAEDKELKNRRFKV